MAMVQIGIRMSYLCISAEVCRQIRVLWLVWRGVGCGGWRGSPRTSVFSYGSIGWNYEGPLKNDKKQLKVKHSSQTRVCLGFIRPKTGTMRFGPMAGLVGCAFYLILECTYFGPNGPGISVFGRCPLINEFLLDSWTSRLSEPLSNL